MKKYISFLLCISLLLCIISGCGNETTEPENQETASDTSTTISLWYVDNGNRIWENLLDVIALYNSGDGVFDKINVIYKSFDTENDMMKKLKITGTKPNIVICSSDCAAAIAADEYEVCTSRYFSSSNLTDIITEYLDSGKLDGTLISIPIAVSANIIMADNQSCQSIGASTDESFSSIEQICTCADTYTEKYEKPYFSADSFSNLFRVLLAQKKFEFHAYKEIDIENENYVYLYNLLAESAFAGSITSYSDDCISLVAQGKLPVALVNSADIIENIDNIDNDSVSFYSCPVISGGKNLYQMNITSLMMLDSTQAKNDATAVFIKWFLTKSYDLTDGTGHLPTNSKTSAAIFNSAPDDGIYGRMISAIKLNLQSCKKDIPSTNANYFKNSQSFESSFRDTLIALN